MSSPQHDGFNALASTRTPSNAELAVHEALPNNTRGNQSQGLWPRDIDGGENSQAGRSTNTETQSLAPATMDSNYPRAQDKKIISQLQDRVIDLEDRLAEKLYSNDDRKNLDMALRCLILCKLENYDDDKISIIMNDGDVFEMKEESQTKIVLKTNDLVNRTLNALKMGLSALIPVINGELSLNDQLNRKTGRYMTPVAMMQNES